MSDGASGRDLTGFDRGATTAGGSVIVEFAILGSVAVLVVMAVVQLALYLFQRNVVVTAVAEGARVGASFGRTPSDGRTATCELIRQTIGERCDVLDVTAVDRDGLIMVAANGTLPPVAPGLPPLRIRHVATMHDEERLYPDAERFSMGVSATHARSDVPRFRAHDAERGSGGHI